MGMKQCNNKLVQKHTHANQPNIQFTVYSLFNQRRYFSSLIHSSSFDTSLAAVSSSCKKKKKSMTANLSGYATKKKTAYKVITIIYYSVKFFINEKSTVAMHE